MDAHQIIHETLTAAEVKDLARAYDRTEELIRSWGRPPRNADNPDGTGNYSAVHHYLKLVALRKGFNREGAIRMHRRVNQEVEEMLADSSAEAEVKPAGIDVLRNAVEVVGVTGEKDLCEASWSELVELDETLGRLDCGVQQLRAAVRVAKRRAELPPRGREFVTIS